MATVKLPFKELSSYTITITLDRKSYIFEFNWNSRFEYWTFSIFLNNETKTPVLIGRKLRIGVPLLKQYKAYKNIPQGFLIVVRSDGGNEEPNRIDLYEENAGIIYDEVLEVV